MGVIQPGKRVHTSHYGYLDGDSKASPNDDTVYHLGSLTKALTAAGLAVLVEEGKL